MIAAPPVEVGAVKETVAVVAPVTEAVIEVGVPGVNAVIAPVTDDEFVTEDPTPFDAVTVVLKNLPISSLVAV